MSITFNADRKTTIAKLKVNNNLHFEQGILSNLILGFSANWETKRKNENVSDENVDFLPLFKAHIEIDFRSGCSSIGIKIAFFKPCFYRPPGFVLFRELETISLKKLQCCLEFCHFMLERFNAWTNKHSVGFNG